MLKEMLKFAVSLFFISANCYADVIFNTDNAELTENGTTLLTGDLLNKKFTCSNNITWTFKLAAYNLESEHYNIFSYGKKVFLKGSNPLVIRTRGDIVVNTTVDVSGVPLNASGLQNHLGGFALTTKNCCFVGAGPGAGFTYHGGGYGGAGGGSWIDPNNNYFYGRSYQYTGEIIGGSTGAIVYDSDPGTGGGAIAIQANGSLVLGSRGKIIANGYSVTNTSYPACSGGSSGGKIVLAANKVVLEGELSAVGGNSGKTSNYSDYCGDGGGGGVILVKSFSYHTAGSFVIKVEGGKGLVNGTNGIKKFSTKHIQTTVINTTSCVMTINGNLADNFSKHGNLSSVNNDIGCTQWSWKICTFTFEHDFEFSKGSNVTITGSHALKIVSLNGHLSVSTNLDLSARGKMGTAKMQSTFLGGYHNHGSERNTGPGSDVNGAGHGDVNNTLSRSYGIDPTLLIGGSSCRNSSLSAAYGGGAIALEAKKGKILINGNISADAYSENPGASCGASGGTVILDANEIVIKGYVTADGSDGKHSGGDGGVISTTSAYPKALARPGKCIENNGVPGRPGTVKVPGINVRKISRSCFSSTPPMTTSRTSAISSSTASFKTTVSTASSIGMNNQPANSSKQSRFTITENTPLTVGTKAITTASTSDAYTNARNELHSLTISATPSSYQLMQSTSVVKDRNKISKEIMPFVNKIVNSGSALRVSEELAAAVISTREVTADDSHVIMGVIDQIANASIYKPSSMVECQNVTMNVIRSCSKMAKSNFERENYRNLSSELVPRITRTLESLGDVIGSVLKENQTFLMEDDILAIEVTNVDTTNPVDRSFPSSTKAKNREDIVIIPKEIFLATTGSVDVILVQMSTNSTYNNSRDVNGSNVLALSNIIAVKLSKGDSSSLVKPITIRNKLLREVSENQVVRGGFWEARSGDSSGGWSYKGCSTARKGDVVETKSNHMTSFAVLISFKKEKIPDHHVKALGFITSIGCGISLFCLLLTFATFVTLDSLDPERTAIHTNLVVALGIAQIVFLAGINATENKAACTAVAVLLHYFFTAAFSWMFAEGVHLYKKVVSVFSHGSKLKFYYVIGWGLPIIIVALSTGIRPDGYGTESACWISLDGGLIWAFVAPVIIVIIINFIVLIIVVKILMSSVSTVQVDSKTSQETNRSTQQIKAGAKAMVILMPILGLSWVFGLLAVNEATIVFQYLFCIFNSMQGLFIFLIHCVGNSEVRSAFRRLHEKHTVSKSIGERSFAKSISKKSKSGSPGAEILVRRETPTSNDGERTVTPKTLSAGQISLNSLNAPTYNDHYYTDDDR
ncbi:uncharacterized protein LOC135690509 isoform X2 [Rhopilema esculentum]